MLRDCLEENVCLYRPNVWREGEFERLKTPRTTAGELQKIVESQVQKTLRKIVKLAPASPFVVWEGFKKKYLSSSKNKLQHIQLSHTTGTSNGTGFCGQIKPNKKKWNLMNNEIYCCIFDFMGLYFCRRSWTCCLDTWHHGFYQIPTDKKINNWLTQLLSWLNWQKMYNGPCSDLQTIQ